MNYLRMWEMIPAFLSIIFVMGAGAMGGEKVLFDFGDPEAAAGWVAIHDVVMGGLSTGGMETTGEGGLLFAGKVSLENNGGFASIRSRPVNWDLNAYDGLAIRVRGDGKRYKLNIKTDSAFDAVLYRVAFETTEGEWQTLRFPFAEFRASFRGRFIPDAPPLDPARITSVGLLISDKQEGPFRLEMAWISAYTEGDR